MYLSAVMKACIDACTTCRSVCKETLFQHCFELGGKYVEKKHVNLMVDCIEITQIAANLMLRGSDMAAEICKICADICDDCANSCEAMGDEKMEHCAEVCRDCVDACRNMSNMPLGESTYEPAATA